LTAARLLDGVAVAEEGLAKVASAVERLLDHLLVLPPGPERRVIEAMRHATLNGGKRLRPFLGVASAELFGVAEASALRTAAAVEMLHCYSLVHDDLPAMDDSDLRRGRATVHKAYDDATAILAGDGLLTQAFEVLADPLTHSDAEVRADLVLALARAAGTAGMVGGQMFDLSAESLSLDIGAITRLQRLKTGEIIAFSCVAGAILGRASEPARAALHAFAHDLGLAFQIVDDLLDAEGDATAIGKPVGQDKAAGKATFVSILGLERARLQAQMLARQAAQHLDFFEGKADLLKSVARFVTARRR
jgi:farnesyl diphosphate synthase